MFQPKQDGSGVTLTQRATANSEMARTGLDPDSSGPNIGEMQ